MAVRSVLRRDARDMHPHGGPWGRVKPRPRGSRALVGVRLGTGRKRSFQMEVALPRSSEECDQVGACPPDCAPSRRNRETSRTTSEA